MDLNTLIVNLRIRNSIYVFTNVIFNIINCLKFIKRAEVEDIKRLTITLEFFIITRYIIRDNLKLLISLSLNSILVI